MPERDPDELLKAFERATASVSRPSLPAPRKSVIPRVAVAAVIGLVLAAAVGAAVVYGPRLVPPAAGERLELPTHRDLDGYPAALLTGWLVRDGNCVYAAGLTGSGRDLVVWPSGTVLVVTRDESVVVSRGGDRIAAIGEPIELGGGEIPSPHVETLLETEIPDECVGPYWLASSARSPLGEPQPATWRLMPVVPVARDTTKLNLMITEQDCDYGVRPESAVDAPQVEYRPEAVVVTVSVRTFPGTCPGDENSFRVVTLEQPLGDRQLIDGGDHAIEWQPQLGLIALPHPSFPAGECYGTYLEGAYLAGEANDSSVAWVSSAVGQRVNVLWPDGYTARFAPSVELVGPIGQFVARAGDELTLGGGFMPSGEFAVCEVNVGPLDIGGGPLPWPNPTTAPTPVAQATPSPAPALLDSVPVGWKLDAGAPVGPETTTLHVLVAQTECGFEADSLGHLLPPQVTYSSEDIIMTLTTTPGFALESCAHRMAVRVAAVVTLDEPVGGRVIRDGNQQPAPIRWRTPGPDVVPLPTTVTEPAPLGRIYVALCAGVGLDAFLTGAANDPRIVWLEGPNGNAMKGTLYWPPGFGAQFGPDGVEILDEAGNIAMREHDHVDGACGASKDGIWLYSHAYIPIEPITP